jgi:hypothetical protein
VILMRTTTLAALIVIVTGASAPAQFYVAGSNVWVAAQERARVEYRANNFTFDSSVGADEDWFLLNRARLGVGAEPFDWLTIYGELQDAREIGSRRVPPDRNLDEDTIDFHQGWFAVANYADFPVGAKLGRQELSYGDERMIGLSDWSNTGRVFDALKLRWQLERCWVDFFAANVVVVDDNSFDDKPDWADDFYGLYGHTDALEKHVWELYALYRDKQDAVNAGAARQLYTLGTRFATNPKMAPWDYTVELIGQFGHVQTPGGQFGEASAAWARHEALASAVSAGYTFHHDWKPRLGVGYDYASGDRNSRDGKDGTFDPLYATSHRPLGFIDLVGFKNIHNPRATFSVWPRKTVKLQLDGHLFWLAEARDAWYRSNNSAVRRDATGNSGNFLGSEIDLTATYTPHARVKVQAGYSHFFTGDFVRDTGAHSDAEFFYTQVAFSY